METIFTLSLLMLVPVYGQLVIWGYCYRIVEHLLFSTEATTPPYQGYAVNWYMARSAWSGVPMLFLYVIGGMFVFFAGSSTLIISIVTAFGGPDSQAAVFGILFPVVVTLIVSSLLIGSGMLLVTTLRMALMQDFREGFRFAWLFDFWRKTWLEIVLSSCFLWVTFVLMMLAGSAFFCLGIAPAFVICYLAQSHIQFQLYRLYIRRGGKPFSFQRFPDFSDRYY